MQRKPFRNKFRTSLLAASVWLAFAGMAHAQVISQETDTVKGRAPTLATATITGTPSGANSKWIAGDVLTAVYTVADQDNDTPDMAASDLTVQWTSDGVAVGSPGSKTYTIQASDAGKTITYQLVPHTDPTITDPFQGAVTTAASVGADGSGGPGGIVEPAGSDEIMSVAITGNALVSDTLTAVPTCVSACTGNITYQWQVETAVGSGTYTNIPGATSGTYSPTKDDQKRRIKVVASQ